MKITSRETETIEVHGKGEHVLGLTTEQVNFIAAVCYITRLSDKGYGAAVSDLIELLQEKFGPDYLTLADIFVGMHASLNNPAGGSPVMIFGSDDITLEV